MLGQPGGVSTLYAEHFTGPPSNESYLEIAEASSSVVDGRVSLAFSRPLVGGKLLSVYNVSASLTAGDADFLWAVGSYGDGFPGYHSTRRGMYLVNWADPSSTMGYLRCQT